jgi:hypothetical protein
MCHTHDKSGFCNSNVLIDIFHVRKCEERGLLAVHNVYYRVASGRKPCGKLPESTAYPCATSNIDISSIILKIDENQHLCSQIQCHNL